MVYPTSIYILSFKYNYGIAGIWASKILVECCNSTGYITIIGLVDWNKIGKKALQK